MLDIDESGSKRDTSGEVLSEPSGLPIATSAVSAGDVGDGVTETRDGSAGTSCGVTTTFDLANGTAGAKRKLTRFLLHTAGLWQDKFGL